MAFWQTQRDKAIEKYSAKIAAEWKKFAETGNCSDLFLVTCDKCPFSVVNSKRQRLDYICTMKDKYGALKFEKIKEILNISEEPSQFIDFL